MLRIGNSDRDWYEQAKERYGALTCTNCFNQILKDKESGGYYCDTCMEVFDSELISDQFAQYNSQQKQSDLNMKKADPKEEYVIYAKGTDANLRALYKRKNGRAAYYPEADAPRFTKSEVDRIHLTDNNYEWIIKRLK